MSRKQYFVSCEDGEWIIKLGDQYIGGYPSEAAPLRAAVDAAYLEGSRGSDAEVLALTENNMFRTKWTYGHDPYPPTKVALTVDKQVSSRRDMFEVDQCRRPSRTLFVGQRRARDTMREALETAAATDFKLKPYRTERRP